MISTKTLLYGVLILILLDVVTTLIAVIGMGATELNPLSDIFGFYWFMVAKIIISIGAAVFMYKYALPSVPTATRYGVMVLGLVYGAVFISNTYRIAEAMV